jgi:hypothetical protein
MKDVVRQASKLPEYPHQIPLSATLTSLEMGRDPESPRATSLRRGCNSASQGVLCLASWRSQVCVPGEGSKWEKSVLSPGSVCQIILERGVEVYVCPERGSLTMAAPLLIHPEEEGYPPLKSPAAFLGLQYGASQWCFQPVCSGGMGQCPAEIRYSNDTCSEGCQTPGSSKLKCRY